MDADRNSSPKSPAGVRQRNRLWARVDDLPLSLQIALPMTIQFSGLSLIKFIGEDAGRQPPLVWVWLIATILLLAVFSRLILVRPPDGYIMTIWLGAAIGVLVLEIANGHGAAGKGATLGLCGGILMAHWIANSRLAHWDEDKRNTARVILIQIGCYAGLPVGFFAGKALHDAVASGSLRLF